MQSIFRLPGLAWSQPAAAALDKPVSFAPLANGTVGNSKVKRKRTAESPRSSPQPVVKKIKAALPQHVEGGAVQVVAPGGLPEQLVRVSNAESKPAGMALPVTQLDSRFATAGASKPLVPAAYTAAMARHHSLAVSKAPLVPLAPSVKPVSPPQHINTSVGMTKTASRLSGLASPSPAPALARAQPNAVGGMAPPTPVTPSTAVFPGTNKSPSSHPLSAPKQKQSTSVSNLTMDKDMLRAIIDAEICQAILFKHNELRLIDQEIAKCQVALEQIRRCEEIPFPGSQGMSMHVSAHSGPALATRRGLIPPASPAPWGVTDGPYTRHYASWLIPSDRFDATAPRLQTQTSTPLVKDGRITRGLSTDMSPMPGSIPPSRASRVASRAKALDPASPLTGRDPLIIKRQKDGQMVKLYCTQCQPERSDFANVQGFLNHCRISHKNDFKSHEQAAIECGRIVEPGDYFTPQEVATPRETIPKPSFIAPPAHVATPIDRSTVHALNKPLTANRQASLEQYVPRTCSKAAQKQSENALPTPVVSPSFSPAPQTPYLSKLVQKAGSVHDFARVVTDAKQKIDTSVYDVESEAETHEVRESKSKSKGSQSKNNKSAGQRASTTGRRAIGGRVNGGKFGKQITAPTDPDAMDIDQAPSPHTSADSNPGLVSDREDDFADEDDEPEVLRNPSQGEIVLVRIEDSDGERGVHATSNTGVCANGIPRRN